MTHTESLAHNTWFEEISQINNTTQPQLLEQTYFLGKNDQAQDVTQCLLTTPDENKSYRLVGT